MVNSLDNMNISSFESLSILSPSSKPLAEDAHGTHGAGREAETDDDTESFDEEDCLFMEGHDREAEETEKGAFHLYSNASLQSNSACSPLRSSYLRPNSPCEWLNPAREWSNSECHQKENMAPCDLHAGDMRFPSEMDARCKDRRTPLDIATVSLNTLAFRRARKVKKNSPSVRESLLAEAWERKRELMLNEELANFKEQSKPELLGRSSSDCGKLATDAPTSAAPSELRRSRTRSLTDEDFEELKGCIDLGFRFDQSSSPDLYDTLPALEVYCAVAQSLQESPRTQCLNSPGTRSPAACSSPSTTSTWRISSPGDDPKDVKGRLRHWAQAVACNAKLCH